ncbi:ubiquitination network signaling protein [Niveomyces insectorum RCEF 264]|uniref:Ubiquitination network signaling protein n=1 Tax=Niveomyces insectorum RCEF 264 TaxID=1081102 RepID=A0A162IFS3_9HYPO|nr:ubiquitination network signaling protein [Niveomyces insectorum RCEF 264]
MSGLANSRWAVKDARSSSVPAAPRRIYPAHGHRWAYEDAPVRLSRRPVPVESAAAELARYSKIVRRMKWKLPFLDAAYQQATTTTTSDGEGDGGAARKTEAELMFKLDFFEYYMLCERALVHLQGVFGISISRDAAVPGARRTTGRLSSSDKEAPAYVHRYHANVLEALDHEDNPLHEVLGVGDVRWQLAKAKDLRNRWKNADGGGDVKVAEATAAATATATAAAAAKRNGAAANVVPLATYNLADILAAIHGGLDRAFVVASDFVVAEVARHGQDLATNAQRVSMDVDTGFTEEEQWGFMVEAMDWEAV